MSTISEISNFPFIHGASWLRADFHLHTRADKEFSYTEEQGRFVSDYVSALKAAGISVGVITNHNKFDLGEFRAIRKAARKENIFLLPGVELSVNDGANGVHTLVVFSDEWLEDGGNYINQFFNVTFQGKAPSEYEQKNGRSSQGLMETLGTLEDYKRDYFLVFAHVEQSSGLWEEMHGGRIVELGKEEVFRNRTLGFQKVRTHLQPERKCRVKVKDWLADWYPAEVEGSDCKSISEIGKGTPCFLKIGDFTFEAVKYALLDYGNRVANEAIKSKHSQIVSVAFEGGCLAGKTVNFASGLNALIGIRGSGKSSILECIRYALDVPFGVKAADQEYKNELVRHTLGSGGKITIQALDRHGQQFKIQRILDEAPDVFVNGTREPGVSIRETVIHDPIYFGQKDLSNTGVGFERDLVEKLLGKKLDDVRGRIKQQQEIVAEIVSRLAKFSNIATQKQEFEKKQQDAEFRLKVYKQHGIEEKLQRQLNFEEENRTVQSVVKGTETFLQALSDIFAENKSDLMELGTYNSKQNEAFFTQFFEIYGRFLHIIDTLEATQKDGSKVLEELKTKAAEFDVLRQGQKDEFAEVQRNLTEELKQKGQASIRPDDFLELRKTVDEAKEMLEALKKQQETRSAIRTELLRAIGKLNDLWHEEFCSIQAELEKINAVHAVLSIEAAYKGDKDVMLDFFKSILKGSRIRESTQQTLVEEYADFGAMYQDWESAKSKAGSNPDIFQTYFGNNMADLLQWQTPNRFTIKYRGKELRNHSLGQRASALILFVLSQKENDVIIIDQPEDDLDNQTIYEDVIKLIRGLKTNAQFIFATHNANFPVLGDAEQVHSCHFIGDEISIKSGGIDDAIIQKEIVDIMEGGPEAFERRKEIYTIWKPN